MAVIIGGLYEHYKGNKYKVVDVARHSETLEKLVVYRALYGDGDLWVRPYEMFCENVLIDKTEVPRFKYLGNELESIHRVYLDFPEDLKQAFFQSGIDVEQQIIQEIKTVAIEHKQVNDHEHKKDVATVILVAGASVSLVLLCVLRLVRAISERPRIVKVIERDLEGSIIKEKTVLLEPKKTNQKMEVDLQVGTSAISFKFTDESK